MISNKLTADSRFLFIGDSVTDSGCRELEHAPFGHGYVRLIDAGLARNGLRPRTINQGVSGNQVKDLRERWTTDCLELRPDHLTISIGVNDTWRRYDKNAPVRIEDFERDYREIVDRALSLTTAQLVLVSPFILPVRPEQETWREEDLSEKIAVVEALAVEHSLGLVRADEIMREQAEGVGSAALADDGIHPTPLGHGVLADAWLSLFDLALESPGLRAGRR